MKYLKILLLSVGIFLNVAAFAKPEFGGGVTGFGHGTSNPCSGPAAIHNPFCGGGAGGGSGGGSSGGSGGSAGGAGGGSGGATQPPAATSTPSQAAPAQQPAQQPQQKGLSKLPGYIAMGGTAIFFMFVICEREAIAWCQAPAWLRGPLDDRFDQQRYGVQ